MRDDDDASEAVLNEIGDCNDCLRNMAMYLAGMAGAISVSLAENAGADRAAAIRQWEAGLAGWSARLP